MENVSTKNWLKRLFENTHPFELKKNYMLDAVLS